MTSKNDFHNCKFDECTKTKLDLYKNYIKEWLPVFVNSGKAHVDNVNIFDLFCGPGYDSIKTPGSPIILVDSINNYAQQYGKDGMPFFNIVFNDNNKDKIQSLRQCLGDNPLKCNGVVNYETKEFGDVFKDCFRIMSESNSPNFIFIDQFGIKALTPEVFSRLVSVPRTDWLCFIASNIVYRMRDHPAITEYIKIAESGRWADIHRMVTDYYRQFIKADKEYYLVPFSLKKGANIYGLIFGSGHALGAEKFINTCWRADKISGEANFDIESAGKSSFGQLMLLPPKKITNFERELEKQVLGKKILTNQDVYNYALHAGVKSEHAREAIKKLAEKGLIKNKRLPISYSTVFREKKIVNIELGRL